MLLPSRLAAGLVAALALALGCSKPAASGEVLSGSASLAAAQQAARRDGKPVLVLVRNPGDVGSLDAGHWLAEDPALAAWLDKFHRVVLWNFDPACKGLPLAPRRGLLFLTSQGEPIAWEEIPGRRADLEGLLRAVLAWPFSLDEMLRSAWLRPNEAVRFWRAFQVLRKAGRADHALQLWWAAQTPAPGRPAGSGPPPDFERGAEGYTLEKLLPQAYGDAAQRLRRVAETLERFWSGNTSETRPPREQGEQLFALLKAPPFLAQEKDEILQGCVDRAYAAWREWNRGGGEKDGEAEKLFRERLEALRVPLQARAERWRQEARRLSEAYAKTSLKSDLDVLRGRLHGALEALGHKREEEETARWVTEWLLRLPLDREESARTAGLLAYALAALDLELDLPLLAQKIAQECPTGRHAAAALLDLADLACAKGRRDEAKEYWKAAEKAAAQGESPTLYRTARAMRALAEGKNSPRRSRWAKREVLDVLVLVPDLETFAAALARWTDKQFFPVLFQDDLYAPKFADAFKPAQVLQVPSARTPGARTSASTLDPETLRHALLSSWTPEDKKAVLPSRATASDLRARLQELHDEPQGLVLGDGISGETAGGLALAAGRFQGFEFLAPPARGSPGSGAAGPEALLAPEAAWNWAGQVREALARWSLPPEDRWAALTLAGRYPWRYRGEVYAESGAAYALDDLLGRAEDSTRLAVTGRLLGDPARSAYQAMCSLFLKPGAALLFNTYGLQPRTEFGSYRLDPAAEQLQAWLSVTHLSGAEATLPAFLSQIRPWNRHGLIVLNSSGGPARWSVPGGGGTPDDFPIGAPTALHVTHSGSAADLENPDSLAGRALWGGAFWYFGAMAEPYLSAFQPAGYYAPRLAAGAPFAAVFRQREGQSFGPPWRLLAVGDPLFCLREKPAKRREWKSEKGPLVRAGEMHGSASALEKLPEPAAGVPYAAWLARLRQARWSGNRPAAQKLASQPPPAAVRERAGLALLLEEELRAGEFGAALRHWQEAPATARDSYASSLSARLCARALLEDAWQAQDLGRLWAQAAVFLTTGPAPSACGNWLDRLGRLALEKKERERHCAWLNARIAEAGIPAACRAVLEAHLNRLKTDAAQKQEGGIPLDSPTESTR